MIPVQLDTKIFIDLLAKLVSETQQLQNNPPNNIPKEGLACKHVMDILEPYSVKNNGSLHIEQIDYVKGRSNLIVKYLGTTNKTLTFAGSHFDVVSADPKEWKRNPFKLIIEQSPIINNLPTEPPIIGNLSGEPPIIGNLSGESPILYGRGTSDCLCNVALLTDLMRQLAIEKPVLKYNIYMIVIANEEHGGDLNVGINHLFKDGKLTEIKNGPVYWLDSADIFPTIATGSHLTWKLTVNGKKGHSGHITNTINPILLGMEALKVIMGVVHKSFPKHPKEIEYQLHQSTNMKPIYVHVPEGSSVNQIPDQMTILGDVRIVPFYKIKDVQFVIEDAVKYLNNNMKSIPTFHSVFKNVLDDNSKGYIKIEWTKDPYVGIACDLNSIGYKLLAESTKDIMGVNKSIASLGSLPLVADLQNKGYDVQIMGYGVGDMAHSNDEYCRLGDVQKGFRILSRLLTKYNNSI